MSTPLVSIIVPVGPRHVEHARLAAASVARQSLAALCETIIICDGAADAPPLPGCAVLPSDGRQRGPAHTRNRGIAAARGAFILPLDADDWLLPHAVEHLLREYSRGTRGYVYGDCYTEEPWDKAEQFRGQNGAVVDDTRRRAWMYRSAPDYVQAHMRSHNIHVVTALIPTHHARAVGGYDEGVDAWEDWSFHLRLAIAGVCGYRLPIPIFVYRVWEGDRMQRFYGGDTALMEAVLVRYRDATGGIPMAGCCGGDATLARLAQGATRTLANGDALPLDGGRVRIEYLGDSRGTIPLEPTPGHVVRLADTPRNRYADVTPAEAAWIAERLPIRIVPIFDTPQSEPAPLESAAAVLTPDVAETKALRPRGRRVAV